MADQTGMQLAEPQEAPAVPVVKQVKQLLSQDKIKEKFGEVLGQKAPQFMASITNTVSGSTQLKKCPANSIIGAAFVAATYDLPIDSTYFSGYEKFYDTQGKMTWKEPPYELFDPETGHQQFYDLCMNAKALVICYQEKRAGETVGYQIALRLLYYKEATKNE